jgi:hypothetical protein
VELHELLRREMQHDIGRKPDELGSPGERHRECLQARSVRA